MSKEKATPQSFSEYLESEMSKETVKLYSHDGTFVNVLEMTKDEAEQFEIGYRHGWFNSYEDAKEDLEFNKRIEFVFGDNSSLRGKVVHLERKLNGKDNRVDSLSDKIDNIKKECKRGQDMLLDRIKELESELDPKDEQKSKKELNVFEIMLAIGIGWFLGFGLFHLLN